MHCSPSAPRPAVRPRSPCNHSRKRSDCQSASSLLVVVRNTTCFKRSLASSPSSYSCLPQPHKPSPGIPCSVLCSQASDSRTYRAGRQTCAHRSTRLSPLCCCGFSPHSPACAYGLISLPVRVPGYGRCLSLHRDHRQGWRRGHRCTPHRLGLVRCMGTRRFAQQARLVALIAYNAHVSSPTV